MPSQKTARPNPPKPNELDDLLTAITRFLDCVRPAIMELSEIVVELRSQLRERSPQ